MSKMKLVEMTLNSTSEAIEDLNTIKQPDYQITDVTVISDEDYHPTIQAILIDLEESHELHESQSKQLSINILSETVNDKTGYSNSLFEFESNKGTITLSLALSEHEKYNGVFNVSAYTTKGEKVFETNTQFPRTAIKNYMNSLSNEYLIEAELSDASKFEMAMLDMKVNGPKFRGDSYPKSDPSKVNEEAFEDNMRFKEFDIHGSKYSYKIDWITQEPFEDDDVRSFIEEISRWVKYTKDLNNITDTVSVEIEVTSRDGIDAGHYSTIREV